MLSIIYNYVSDMYKFKWLSLLNLWVINVKILNQYTLFTSGSRLTSHVSFPLEGIEHSETNRTWFLFLVVDYHLIIALNQQNV